MSRKVWVVLLVGQVTVKRSTDFASRRPIDSTRVLPPKLPLLPITRWIDRGAVGARHVDLDLGADRRPVGPGADEPDLQPVAPVPGVLEQGVVAPVAGVAAAEDDEEVEVAVVVPVGERDAVSLLEVAGAGRLGHVLESAPSTFLIHQVRDQARQAHPARPEVDVEIAVVVDVAEVGAHDRHRPGEADLPAHLAEAVRAEVVVEVRMVGFGDRQAEVIGDDLGQALRVVVDEEVEPAVVVVVPEPCRRSRLRRPDDAELAGDVDERAVAAVVVEPARAVHVRDEQVEPAVVVVVAPGRPLGHMRR